MLVARPWYRSGGVAVVVMLLVFALTMLTAPPSARAHGRLPRTAVADFAVPDSAVPGDDPAINVEISMAAGAAALVGAAVIGPTEPPAPAQEPTALPATGNGGIEDDGGPPAWVWGVIAAVAVAAIAAGGAYRLWLRSRSR